MHLSAKTQRFHMQIVEVIKGTELLLRQLLFYSLGRMNLHFLNIYILYINTGGQDQTVTDLSQFV